MKTHFLSFTILLLVLVAGAQELDINAAKTRQVKSEITSDTLILTDIDGDAIGTAITAMMTNEAALRVEGDVHGTNYTDFMSASVWTNLHIEIAVHTNRADNPHGVTATQIGAATTGSLAQVEADIAAHTSNAAIHLTDEQSAKIEAALTNETDTLSSVAARGGFSGTETITPYLVDSKRFGSAAGDGASGDYWCAVGNGAGSDASGDFWTALGRGCGVDASGNGWDAIGGYAGYEAKGDYWSAIGYRVGYRAIWTNSVAVGRYAGYKARGNGNMFLDVFESEPPEDYNSTNDAVFIKKGQLNFGRTGSLTNAEPNRLRGRWMLNGSDVISADTKELHVDSYTNLIWQTVFSNGWVWLVAYTNTP